MTDWVDHMMECEYKATNASHSYNYEFKYCPWCAKSKPKPQDEVDLDRILSFYDDKLLISGIKKTLLRWKRGQQ